jgi:elongator complex protein 3
MKKILEKIVYSLLRTNPKTNNKLAEIKRQIAGKYKLASPSNAKIFSIYQKLLKSKKIKPNENLENILKKRAVRTISGVAPIAVLTKSYPCPGKCAYCPTEMGMPKSYLSNEPAVMRAVLCDFDPIKQVKARVKALEANGHPTDKLELIVIGGTWSALPPSYQKSFIKKCFDAANNVSSKSRKGAKNLAEAQKINETAEHRIVGITLETRPDFITPFEIRKMRELGCTRVELGVQSIYDSILQKNKRGHNVLKTIEATKLLKNAGFKICYHLMPNLPGSTPNLDLKMFEEIFSSPDFQPDMVKIYPCVVIKRSLLYKWWKQGEYKSYSEKQLINLLIKIKSITPPYVRINRLIRDIPSTSIEAGNMVSNLREILREKMAEKNLYCQCIRCREVGHQDKLKIKSEKLKVPKFFITEYLASGGREYFLSFASSDRKILYAFLRLRFPKNDQGEITETFPELKNAALIRELHTYGHLVPIDKTSKGATQHLGLGKKLMQKAEKIVKKHKINKIAVISGIGVREYYKKLGYKKENTYMVKYLNDNL